MLRQEGKLEKIQTRTGEMTVKFLRSCHLEVGMKNNIKWELNPEIVARHFSKILCCGRPTCIKVTRRAHHTVGRVLV